MITYSRVSELFVYDPALGELRWRDSGKIAGEVHTPSRSTTSYFRVQVDGGRYFAHNLVWLILTGEWPSAIVDHVDRDGLNNREFNLRLATASQNKFNSPVYRNSTTGYAGVHKFRDKWRVQISKDGKKFRKLFATLEEAVSFRKQKALELYGEFSG